MNYNDRKKDNIEIDDMKIKSHLNASLDLSGISVSEDLINRTLEAIKKQSAEQQTGTVTELEKKEPSKKVIPWNRYVRGFAGVAAAALIVVAGYGLISSGIGSKKDSAMPESSTNYDMADSTTAEDSVYSALEAAPADDTMVAKSAGNAADTAAADGNTADAANEADNSADNQIAQQFTIAADTTQADEGEGTTGSAGQAASGEVSEAEEQPLLASTASAPLTFREIFLPDPEQAQSLTITDDVNATSITLTSKEEILDFYSVMDKHQFTSGTDSSTGTNYKVEIKSLQPGEAVYSMTIGNNVIVSYQDSQVASQSIYNAADSILLLQDLKDFYDKYNQ